MPRDVNGNYTLPAGNPVVSGTLIESVWANTLTADLAAEMTDSLSRSGKGGFTGPLGIVDFSGSIPGLNFTSEPTSGFKREAAGDTRMQVTSVDAMRFTATTQYALSGGSLKEIVVEEAGQKIMRGEPGVTVIFSYNDTAAPGWSVLVPDANIRQLVVGDIAQGGTIGGTGNPVDNTYPLNASLTNTGLTITGGSTGNEAGHVHAGPNHNHQWYDHIAGQTSNHRSYNAGGGNIDLTNVSTGSPTGVQLRAGKETASDEVLSKDFHTSNSGTGNTGGGSAHSHGPGNLSGSLNNGASTGTVQITPRYARGILIQLDA